MHSTHTIHPSPQNSRTQIRHPHHQTSKPTFHIDTSARQHARTHVFALEHLHYPNTRTPEHLNTISNLSTSTRPHLRTAFHVDTSARRHVDTSTPPHVCTSALHSTSTRRHVGTSTHQPIGILRLFHYLCKPFQDCRGCGEIGRHTRLRIWRREAWGFESLHPHFPRERIEHFLCSLKIPQVTYNSLNNSI